MYDSLISRYDGITYTVTQSDKNSYSYTDKLTYWKQHNLLYVCLHITLIFTLEFYKNFLSRFFESKVNDDGLK